MTPDIDATRKPETNRRAKLFAEDANSIPTPEKLRDLGIDLPELLEVVEEAKKSV